MLSLVLAAILAVAQDETSVPQDPAPEHHCPCVPSYSVALRAGGWWMGGFDAVTPAGRRQIDSTLFFDAGLDLEVERLRWTLSLSGDYAVASDVRVVAGSLRVGRKFPIGGDSAPLDLHVSAGPLFGRLEVDANGFGDFKSAVGGEGRVDLIARVHERISVDFWLAYRQLSFKFDEPRTSGDGSAGGAMGAVGLGLILRF